MDVFSGFTPGLIGEVTALHGGYYGREWGLPVMFEAYVAKGLAEFALRFDPRRDGAWSVRERGGLAAFLAADLGAGEGLAQLRWFIADPAAAGRGLGRRLLDLALVRCREQCVEEIFLWTFAGLHAARALYDRAGFALAEEDRDDRYGRELVSQKLVLRLG
ncbi:MAG: GNAT family N-acetyltransferase [Thermodesulfobacteriota bacterium]